MLLQSGKLRLQSATSVLEIDPEVGGRITYFGTKVSNLLTGPDNHPLYFGSTFWLAPEREWNHPPDPATDRGRYEIEGHHPLSLVSAGRSNKPVGANYRIRKTFEPLLDGAFRVTYEIINRAEQPLFASPWEITRVPTGGRSFFPFVAWVEPPNNEMSAQQEHELLCFEHPRHSGPSGAKMWAHGSEGWLAHQHGAHLLLKSFPVIERSEFAPGESNIELYSSGSAADAYVEVEQLGAYQRIPPESSSSWSVEWRLLSLGDEEPVALTELARLVRDRLQRREALTNGGTQ